MITVILWISGSFLLLQIIVLMYLSFSKRKVNRHDQEVSRIYHQILNSYLAYLHGETEHEPTLPSDEQVRNKVLERLLSGYVSNIKGAENEQRMKEVAERYLTDHYRHVLKKGSWAERINILFFIEDYQMSVLQQEVKNHYLSLKEKDEEYRQALRVLATFGDDKVLEALKNDQTLAVGFMKECFRRLPEEFVEILKKDPELPTPVLLSVISYFGETGHYEHLPYVESQLKHDEKEVRLKSLGALCQYRYISSADRLLPFLTSDIWEERMFAARLAGILQLTRYSTALMELAGDTSWWVRFAACEALKQLPDGEILLTFAAEGHEDMYARDMAKQLQTLRTGVSR
ncbi:HEAT repeat domain-containing protein [Jeotgalibacillus sp. JSM ZJ347]|uniref:HEAT repeat domain-containing protein n=1 Tax=Jeotgalibacillus sp. JSM ZJ347 TaxID=3342117 RepID=UPI0035A838A2